MSASSRAAFELAQRTRITDPEDHLEGGQEPCVNPLLLNALLAGRVEDSALLRMKPAVRGYQEVQNVLIDELVAIAEGAGPSAVAKRGRLAKRATQISFCCNVVLLAVKLVAFTLSGSLVVLASAIDSVLDLVSGGMLHAVVVFMTQADTPSGRVKYPAGLSKLEPVGVMAFSVLMAIASVQLLYESAQVLIVGLMNTKDQKRPNGDPAIFLILAAVVIVKVGLYLWCAALLHQSQANDDGATTIEALRDDHRNDTFQNVFGTASLLLAVYGPANAWVADPAGAMVIASALLYNWFCTGREQVAALIGVTAPPAFFTKLAFLALKYPELVGVDTLRAYTSGNRYLVELDIILPPEMLLRQAHDIGQALQDRIETDTQVERAFVHIDWECSHNIEHQGTPSFARRVWATEGEDDVPLIEPNKLK
ncbi:cation efflux family-domain-containing protein [Pelagophyceae sp. CCMP2097]|nr:cation efflux family-domain-containing protein [Pelagophyceae sp. CCMP2097]